MNFQSFQIAFCTVSMVLQFPICRRWLTARLYNSKLLLLRWFGTEWHKDNDIYMVESFNWWASPHVVGIYFQWDICANCLHQLHPLPSLFRFMSSLFFVIIVFRFSILLSVSSAMLFCAILFDLDSVSPRSSHYIFFFSLFYFRFPFFFFICLISFRFVSGITSK